MEKFFLKKTRKHKLRRRVGRGKVAPLPNSGKTP